MANWFKEFESRPIRSKDEVPWPITIEYEIQSKYFISNLKSLPDPDIATDLELLTVARHCNNLINYVEQMRLMGYTGFPGVIEDLLENEFGNRKKLGNLRRAYIEKWVRGKSGQHKVGDNHFTIHEDKFYYYALSNMWYEVDSDKVFDLMPKLMREADPQTCKLLGTGYVATRYQKIYKCWQDAEYSGKLAPTFFSPKSGQSSPEDVLDDTIKKIHSIIKHPVALKEVMRAIADSPSHLEYLIKVSCVVTDFARQRRASNEHSLYLLRDCAMFSEAQIVIDLLEGQKSHHDQIYLGRQAFSSKKRSAGHWYLCQELLLLSLQEHPHDFTDFYADFTKRLKDYEEYSPEFAGLVQELAQYLGNYIEEAIQNNLTINVVDLGFQGSINMIVKYVLDQYCLQETKIETDIHVYVAAEWFKNVYPNRYTSRTFSLLTDIELMARNDAIYEYVPWSLRDGKLLVAYGGEAGQKQADIELIVTTMTAIIENRH